MFVRRKINPNGNVTVSVIDKSGGKYRTVLTLGTASDPLEIDRLEAKGREYISMKEDPALPLFDSGVDQWIDEFVSGSDTNRLQMAGPDIILGSVYDSLGYAKVSLPEFRHLVVSRCIGRRGVIQSAAYLKDYTLEDHPLSELTACLDEICHKRSESPSDSARLDIERINLCRYPKSDSYLVLADYIPYNNPSDADLQILGRKKSPKAPAKVGIVILVTPDGVPVAYETCTGAALTGKRLYSIAESLVRRYAAEDVTVVAGADILSPAVIEIFRKKGIRYLGSTSAKSASSEGAVYGRNERLAARAAELRNSGLSKLQKKIDSGKVTEANVGGRGYNRFLKVQDGRLAIDYELAAREAENDGLQMFISNADLPQEAVSSYAAVLDRVMAEFAIEGADLMVRPVLYRSRNRIDGHACLCFVSAVVSRTFKGLVSKAGITADEDEILSALNGILQIDYIVEETGRRRRRLVSMDPLQKSLYSLIDDTYKKER